MANISKIVFFIFNIVVITAFLPLDKASGQTCGGGGSVYLYKVGCCGSFYGESCCSETTYPAVEYCSWQGGSCQRYQGTRSRQTCVQVGTSCNLYGNDSQSDLYGSAGCSVTYPNETTDPGDPDDPPPPPDPGDPDPPTPVPPTPTPVRPNLNVMSVAAKTSTGENPAGGWFKTGENIFVQARIRNSGPGFAQAFTSRVMKENQGSKILTISSSAMSAGTNVLYESWTGGGNNTRYSPRSFQQTSAGDYKIGVRANEGNAIEETNYNDNTLYADYEVRAKVDAYVCNDRNENGNCGNQIDSAQKDIDIRLDEDVTSESGFETPRKTIASATNGQIDFDYRAAGHYKMYLADTDSNENWKILGTQSNEGSTASWTSSDSCFADPGPNWTCNLAVVPLHTITGKIFIDTDRDGVMDSGETAGLSNITVRLYDGAADEVKTNSQGVYTFKKVRALAASDEHKIEAVLPSNYTGYPSNRITVSPHINRGEGAPKTYTENIGVNISYTLNGRVFVDSDKDQSYNPSKDMPLSGVDVDVRGATNKTVQTGTDGTYSVPGLIPGSNYEVSTPTGDDQDYIPLNSPWPRVFDITNANPPGQNLWMYGKYTITGNIFVDSNSDTIKNNGELNRLSNPSITLSYSTNGIPKPKVVNRSSSGTYDVENLISRTYTVRYGGLPGGFYMIHPLGTVPPSFATKTGRDCTPSPNNPGGVCSAGGNISELNFAITNGKSWFQALGSDIRFDAGISNPVPANPDSACGGAYTNLPGSSTAPGLAFSGETNAFSGLGQISSTGWIIGNSTYPETYSAKNSAGTETSYAYLQSVVRQIGANTVNLSTYCNTGNCTLPGGLPSGIYQVNGSLNLNTYDFNGNKDYTFLISGSLRINGNLTVANGSTANFSVANNITVAPNIGQTASCPPPAQAQIEGFYSTDDSFEIDSQSNCAIDVPDQQLNMQGSIVVNADLNGGVFQNKRSLCDVGNLQFPSFTIKDRPDLIINTPDFLRSPTYIWQEVAP